MVIKWDLPLLVMEFRTQTPEGIQFQPFLSQMRKLRCRNLKAINYDSIASQVKDKSEPAKVTLSYLSNLQYWEGNNLTNSRVLKFIAHATTFDFLSVKPCAHQGGVGGVGRCRDGIWSSRR